MKVIGSKLIATTIPQSMHSTHTEMKHLAELGGVSPTMLSDTIQELFINRCQGYNVLSSLLSKNKRIIDGHTWEYKVGGGRLKPLTVVEDVEEESNLRRGEWTGVLRVKLDEPWYQAGDEIVPLADDKRYKLRIIDAPSRQGLGFVYTCQFSTAADIKYFPASLFEPGKKWIKVFSSYEEGREQLGSTQFGTAPFALQGSLTRMAKEFSITGDAAQQKMSLKFPIIDDNGMQRKIEAWTTYQEYRFFKEWANEVENALWFSRKNVEGVIKGNTGRPVIQGAGLFQQLEDAQRYVYNELTVPLLESILMDFFYGRVMPGSKRNVVLMTGDYGFMAFDKAVRKQLATNPWTLVSTSEVGPIYKTSDSIHSRSFGVGYRFNEYMMPLGGTIRVVHNPIFDNPDIFGQKIDGIPVESNRMILFDLGDGEDASGFGGNVQIVERKDSFKAGYISGLHTPFGPSSKTGSNGAANISNLTDGFKFGTQYDIGVCLMDPTRVIDLHWRP